MLYIKSIANYEFGVQRIAKQAEKLVSLRFKLISRTRITLTCEKSKLKNKFNFMFY